MGILPSPAGRGIMHTAKEKRGCGTIASRTPFGAPRRPPASRERQASWSKVDQTFRL